MSLPVKILNDNIKKLEKQLQKEKKELHNNDILFDQNSNIISQNQKEKFLIKRDIQIKRISEIEDDIVNLEYSINILNNNMLKR